MTVGPEGAFQPARPVTGAEAVGLGRKDCERLAGLR